MRVKRIDIHGFKSFADPTSFHFDGGLAVLVGPNGSGKSNVVDSFRWVFGMQRPTALRAAEMADVIFAGSSSRPAAGMAEVSVLVDNASGDLPLPYPEVQVTRRLFRTGESEYRINGATCRLKDLREILAGTGLGMDSYSIFEQGKIDALLQANPVDRRQVFEEASGIGRYRQRQREALRKLDATEQSLLRLSDVLAELEREVRSLRAQAGRARSYRELTERYQEVRLQVALLDYDALQGSLGEAREALRGLEASEEESRHAREAAGSATLAAEQRSATLGEELRRREDSLAGVRVEFGQVRERRRFFESKMADLRVELAGLESRRSSLDAGATQREEEARVAAQKAETFATREKDLEDRAREAMQCSRSRADLEGKAHESLEALRSQAVEGERQAVHERNRAASRRSEVQHLAGLLERAAQRHEALGGDLERAREEAARQAREIEAAEAALREIVSRRDLARERSRVEREAEAQERGTLDQSRQEAAALRSRLGMLEDLESRREGVPARARALLAGSEAEGGEGPVAGLLADRLRCDPSLGKAVEAALGAAAKAVLFRTAGDLEDALGRIQGHAGRAMLASGAEEVAEAEGQAAATAGPDGEEGAPGNDTTPECPSIDGVRGWLVASLEIEEPFRPLLHRLLRGVVLVEDRDAARRVRRDHPDLTVVTVGGELHAASGLVEAGEAGIEEGILSRRAEMTRLGEDLQRVEANLARIEERASTRARAAEALEAEAEEAEAEAARRRTDLASRRAEAARIGERMAVLESERELAAVEAREAEEDLARARGELVQAEAAVEAASTESSRLATAVASCEEELARVRHEREVSSEVAREVEIELERARVEGASLRREADRLAQEARMLREDAARVIQEGEGLSESLDRIREDLALLDLREGGLARSLEEGERSLENLRVQAAEVEEQVRAARASEREASERWEGIQESLQQARLRENESSLRVQALVTRFAEEAQVDLEQAAEGASREGLDRELLGREAEQLRQRIARLGPVNLEALEDLQGREERLAFLHRERDDLVQSREKLKEALRVLNRDARARFAETFEKVREGFREVFRMLFGGGKADLFIREGEDILEGGIEIVARPPGKELRTIQLLSGGEKTLTALAVLFAVFRAHPTVFCILDEVDAALDEENLRRFLRLLLPATQDGQFLVISHNRLTMQAAQVLYGVTMRERGVSRRIAVRVAEDGETVEEVAPSATETPAADAAATPVEAGPGDGALEGEDLTQALGEEEAGGPSSLPS